MRVIVIIKRATSQLFWALSDPKHSWAVGFPIDDEHEAIMLEHDVLERLLAERVVTDESLDDLMTRILHRGIEETL